MPPYFAFAAASADDTLHIRCDYALFSAILRLIRLRRLRFMLFDSACSYDAAMLAFAAAAAATVYEDTRFIREGAP